LRFLEAAPGEMAARIRAFDWSGPPSRRCGANDAARPGMEIITKPFAMADLANKINQMFEA
jgi:hypothetical protein